MTSTTLVIPEIVPGSHADQPVEDRGHGAIFQWRDGGRILYTRMESPAQITWDTWEAYFRAIQENWRPDRKALYVFYDLTSPKFGVPLYMSQKVRELMLVRRPYTLYGALLLADNTISTMIAYVLRAYRRSEHTNFSFYTDRDAAQNWLADKLRKNGED